MSSPHIKTFTCLQNTGLLTRLSYIWGIRKKKKEKRGNRPNSLFGWFIMWVWKRKWVLKRKRRGLSFPLHLASGCSWRMIHFQTLPCPSSPLIWFSYIIWWHQRHLSLDTGWVSTASESPGAADWCLPDALLPGLALTFQKSPGLMVAGLNVFIYLFIAF